MFTINIKSVLLILISFLLIGCSSGKEEKNIEKKENIKIINIEGKKTNSLGGEVSNRGSITTKSSTKKGFNSNNLK